MSKQSKGKGQGKPKKQFPKGGSRGGKRSGDSGSHSNPNPMPDSPNPDSNGKGFDQCHTNDISWHNKSVDFQEATRVPFNVLAGVTIPVSSIYPKYTKHNLEYVDAEKEVAFPSMMRINYVPTLGLATDANSAVNRAFLSMWMEMYSKQTGSLQMQPADLAIICTNMASILTNIAMVKRAFGLSYLYVSQNLAFPHLISAASGVLASSIQGRQDEVRAKLNVLIQNFNALKLPNFLDIFKRYYQVALNIYSDEDDVRSQLYALVPKGYYLYHDKGSEISEFSALEYVPFSFNEEWATMHVDDLLDIIDTQIEAWRNSEDFRIIGGSIQRAYSDNQMLHVDLLPQGYVTSIHCDQAMCWQINNATLVWGVDDSSMHVTQDVTRNLIVHKPKIKLSEGSNVARAEKFILNSYNGQTDSEFVMEATRLMVACDEAGNVTICGTEIPTDMYLYYLGFDSGDDMPNIHATRLFGSDIMGDTTVDSAVISSALKAVCSLTKFKYAPKLHLSWKMSDTLAGYAGFIGDLYRYTVVDRSSLEGLMRASMLSLYVTNQETGNVK